jgi:hypothetical protein
VLSGPVFNMGAIQPGRQPPTVVAMDPPRFVRAALSVNRVDCSLALEFAVKKGAMLAAKRGDSAP